MMEDTKLLLMSSISFCCSQRSQRSVKLEHAEALAHSAELSNLICCTLHLLSLHACKLVRFVQGPD